MGADAAKRASTRSAQQDQQYRLHGDCRGLSPGEADAGLANRIEFRRRASRGSVRRCLDNGFPAWLVPLASKFPAEVRAVLMAEIEADIQNTAPGPRAGPLEYAAPAAPEIVWCIAGPLFDLLAARADFPLPSLGPTLSVIVRSRMQSEELASLAVSKFASATDLAVAAAYLGAAFQVEPDQALPHS